MTLAREIEVAVGAARRAATAIMDIYATEFRVSFKDAGHDDPVTAADREANAIIVDALKAAFPDDAIVAEESPIPHDFQRARRCWFVDPLDGTKEFVARNGEFCVMIGLAIEGRASLGVLAVPALAPPSGGEPGFVLVGDVTARQAYLLHGDDAVPRNAAVSTKTDPASITIVVSRSRRSPRIDAFFARLGGPSELPCGSVGVKVAQLVLGRADAYLHPPSARAHEGPKHWDTCAPEAVVLAAGGAFTNIDGAAIDYASSDVVHDSGLVVSNGLLHPALLAAVRAEPRA
ncbi:MAG: 3'(2'),5'-bisphosphate nucleotidase CysQ [Polyangiales bacterium]